MEGHSLLLKPEVGDRLRCSLRKVNDLIATGELESVKIGRRRLVIAESVEALIKRSRVAA